MSSDLSDLKPIEMANGLRGAAHGVADGLVDAVVRCSDELGDAVGAVAHLTSLPYDRARPCPRCADSRLATYLGGVPSRSEQPEVYRVTTAGTALSADQRSRTRKYLISMAIRTACFLGAVFSPSPWRWILLGGALLLPYIAVVMANAGREGEDRSGLVAVVRPRSKAVGSSES